MGPKDMQKGCGYGVAGTELCEKGPVLPQIGRAYPFEKNSNSVILCQHLVSLSNLKSTPFTYITSLLGIATRCWGHMLILSIKTYIFIVDLIKPVEIQYFVF
jgi:hypothetical protein